MTKEEITIIGVGDTFDMFKEKGFRFMSDGGYLEALDDNDGFIFVVYLAGIDPQRKRDFRK